MTEYVFVNDFFAEELTGGAELTSESLIDVCNHKIHKIKSINITDSLVENLKEFVWIFGNFTQINTQILIKFIKSKIKYHIVEYDFKFCKFRSPEKHSFHEGGCNCEDELNGKLISLFFSKSESMWFMSEKQRQAYLNKFSFLNKNKSYVLSSIFSQDLLEKIQNTKVDKNDEWVILQSHSWIKGTQDCVNFAKQNNIPFRLVGGISHKEMIDILSKSKGLIFMPKGGDTCPRIVIEAHLLDCELILNDNVMHKDEEWFTGTKQQCINYLKNRSNFFWNTLNKEF